MTIKNLHIVSAVIETGAGVALLVVPALVVRLLFEAEISGAAIPLGRLTGVALLALAVACWLACGDTKSRAARGLVGAMLVYNIGAVVILGLAGIHSQTTGIALWPAAILHAVMAAWCVRVSIVSWKIVPH
jgi:hypothetical protein